MGDQDFDGRAVVVITEWVLGVVLMLVGLELFSGVAMGVAWTQYYFWFWQERSDAVRRTPEDD